MKGIVITVAGFMVLGYFYTQKENKAWGGKDMAIHKNERYTNSKHKDYINSSTAQPQWIPFAFLKNLKKNRHDQMDAIKPGSILGIQKHIETVSSLHVKHTMRSF